MDIEIDRQLISKAMDLSGHKTERETINAALELLVTIKLQETIRQARGKLPLDWRSGSHAPR
jgi:Arc/MetJ family transcription regulator